MAVDDRSAGEPPVVFPRNLLIDCQSHYYAMLHNLNDEVMYRHRGQFPLYDSLPQLRADLAVDGLDVDDDDEPDVVDSDRGWTSVGPAKAGDDLDCPLETWNALEEVAAGLGVPMNFKGKIATKAYAKLFWGLNLPSVTPPGEHYLPLWSPREISKIAKVLRSGRSRIQRAVAERRAAN